MGRVGGDRENYDGKKEREEKGKGHDPRENRNQAGTKEGRGKNKWKATYDEREEYEKRQ